jgi:hypothetical protein
MRVRVDEARQHTAAPRIHDGCVGQKVQPSLPTRGGPNPDDLPMAGGYRRVFEQTQGPVTLSRLAGHQLANPVYDQIRLDHRDTDR